jgi:hypothetical protein
VSTPGLQMCWGLEGEVQAADWCTSGSLGAASCLPEARPVGLFETLSSGGSLEDMSLHSWSPMAPRIVTISCSSFADPQQYSSTSQLSRYRVPGVMHTFSDEHTACRVQHAAWLTLPQH